MCINSTWPLQEANLTRADKGTCQKLLSLAERGGGLPPLSAKFFEHNDFPLMGGDVPPYSVKEKLC